MRGTRRYALWFHPQATALRIALLDAPVAAPPAPLAPPPPRIAARASSAGAAAGAAADEEEEEDDPPSDPSHVFDGVERFGEELEQ